MSKFFLGLGVDSERIYIEKTVHGCWLIHCEGNNESPFEFSSELQARQFADLVIMQRIGEL